MQDNLYLYPNLVKVRKARRMTQSELAKLIGISQQEISRYENGDVKAPINYIVDLANCFNVTTDYILGRDEMNRDNITDDKNILNSFNQLTDENKIRVSERIKTLLDLQNEKGEPNI